MSRFGRRGRRDRTTDEGTDEGTVDAVEPDRSDDPSGADGSVGGTTAGTGARAQGPWDASEVDEDDGRVDLGGLRLPAREGVEVRLEADQASGTVVAVTMVVGDGALQVQPFAAPRTEGIWAEVRGEIRAGITKQGGTADEVDGPMGPELRTRVPVRGQSGGGGAEPARFLGVDGPRWFLRGVLSGRAAVEEEAAATLLELFRDVVVVRGSAPMAPRDPIPLRLPAEAQQAADEGVAESGREPLGPLERGPEITETR